MSALALWMLVFPTAPADELSLAVPSREAFRYAIEWRLFTAGGARLEWSAGNEGLDTNLQIVSAGLVNTLYRVDDRYSGHLDGNHCATATLLKAQEGRRRRETRITFDQSKNTATYLERDVAKNATILAKEIDTPPCVLDVIGALYRLRSLDLAIGKSLELPVSDGKKAVMAKVEAQARETIKTPAGQFPTVRYEAFLFNEVLYKRSGRVIIWISDDSRRLPVQMQVRLQFHIGTITVQLEKYET